MQPTLRKEKMETKILYKIAEKEDITVDFVPLSENRAFSLIIGNKGFIAMDKHLVEGSAAERVALAHELGHLQTGAVYSIHAKTDERLCCERAAQRWAIKTLVPYSELVDAAKRGQEDLPTLAEHFGVTEDFMQKAIRHYCENKIA